MEREVLIATRNPGKFAEISQLLKELPLRAIGLDEAMRRSEIAEVEEPAQTFEGNAIIKAMQYGWMTGLLTLADDSGLMVDALDGRPGVLSARYAPGTDTDRCHKLLVEMRELDDDRRTAQFVSCVAIYDPKSGKIRTCQKKHLGLITNELSGSNGFGYDPIFYDPVVGKTNAQMTIEEKNQVSHRGQAVRAARQVLEEEFLLDFLPGIN